MKQHQDFIKFSVTIIPVPKKRVKISRKNLCFHQLPTPTATLRLPNPKAVSFLHTNQNTNAKLVQMRPILTHWHKVLNLSRQPLVSWHRDRIREELLELKTAESPLGKLSETSDVFFALSRAQHDGFLIRQLPEFRLRHVLVS